jgi:hypothetical protein
MIILGSPLLDFFDLIYGKGKGWAEPSLCAYGSPTGRDLSLRLEMTQAVAFTHSSLT